MLVFFWINPISVNAIKMLVKVRKMVGSYYIMVNFKLKIK